MDPELIADRYRVIRPIGRGGMGTVWLCRDEVLNRDVAVKQIGALPGEDTESTTRAMREARVTAAMNHNNAVSVFDVTDYAGGTWLVMEYLPSQTLAELVRAEGALPPNRAARIGAQIADALASAHGLGIVHRDIKPGNVLVGEGDRAKISDFGIARAHTDMSLTQTGMMTGTPGYFSPELARGDDPSFASDAWALGATLYTATHGEPPFPGQPNPLAMLSAITRDGPPRPDRAGALAPVISALMDPDPSKRWSMAQARNALHQIAEQGHLDEATRAFSVGASGISTFQPDDQSAGPDTTPVVAAAAAAPAPTGSGDGWTSRWDTTEQPPGQPPRRRRGGWMLAALAVLVLLGLGVAAWAAFGPGANPSGHTAGTPPTHRHSTSQTSNSSTGGPDTTPGTTPGTTPETTPATTTDTTSSTSPVTTDTTPPRGGGSSARAEAFVSDYYTLVPGNTDAGWAQLSPAFQARETRANYDNFWNGINSVDVTNVNAVSPTVVDYTISYDGSTPENKQITLQKAKGGSYLIDSDGSAG